MKLTFLFLSSLVAAVPLVRSSLNKRQVATLCDRYAYWSNNEYEVNNNLWGQGEATSGEQCTYVDGSSASGVQWHTNWEWTGGQNKVKSYVYSGRKGVKGRKIASVSSMQTSVSWGYDTDNIRANVAYDIFTSADPDHATSGGDYEVMIWLAKYGDVQPIGEIMMTVDIKGHTWDLWVGMSASSSMQKVFSFVAKSNIGSFDGDVKDFFNCIEGYMGFQASEQYMIVFQLGTEAFTGGPATMSVSQFSATITGG